MKKIILAISLILMGCDHDVSDDSCIVKSAYDYSDNVNYKNHYFITCKFGYLDLHTDSIYTIGDTIQIFKK